MTVSLYEFTATIVGIFCTWGLYTQFFAKPTPFRSFASNAYIGIGMGMVTVINIWFIYNNGILPMMRGEWWMAIGIALAALMISRINRKYSYLARLPIAITVGTGLGLGLRTQITTSFIYQVLAMVVPPIVPGDITQSIYNSTNIIVALCLIMFFVYTRELKGPLSHTTRLGAAFLYIGLGTIFAQTFMGRLSMFTGYMQQIMTPEWKIPYALGIAVIVFGATIVMDRYGLLDKYG